MLTAFGRLLPSALVGRWCFSCLHSLCKVVSVGVGRLDVLSEHAIDNLRYISVFIRLSGRGWYIIPLAPVSRQNALYLRFNGLLLVVWYLIPHTTLRAVRRKVCRYCDNTYRLTNKVVFRCNSLYPTLFITRRLR